MTSTEYKHPKCYANVDGGCSTKISGEHYISHGLIKLYTFNDATVKILHDNGRGIPHPVPAKNFVANILCTAHNNGMSALDTSAIELATFLQRIALDWLGGNGTWGVDETIQISGDDFQRWALKLLLNHAATGAFTANAGPVAAGIPDDAVRLLLGTKPWPTTGGLCVSASPDHRFLKFDPFTPIEAVVDKWWGAYPFFTHADNSLCGGIVELAGIGFGLALDEETRGYPNILRKDNPLRDTLQRPSYMAWNMHGIEKRIKFIWSDSANRDGITYTMVR
ncbi:hypothetical protein [Nocardia brasiliensis]|uniref:hypothetical protein n=1 Tax=Nocardia brasiliensis TaxID=37326 RepID=UPI0033C1A8E1